MWDVKGNKEIRRWKGSSDYISSLVFDPHEKYIATDSANSTIKIWEIASGKNVMTMSRKSKSSYMDIAYSPNGKYIASVSRDTIVSIWDTKTGEIVKSLKGKSAFSYVIFSPNCKLLATSSYDSAVRLWNVSSGDLVRTFGNCKGGINSISFSSDGTQIVAASMDNEMFVWDINMSKPLIEKKGRAESGYYASFSPNSNEELIASFSVDKTIRIWNSKTGKETLSLDCHSNSVHWVLLSQDCKYVICAFWDGSVRYWSYPPLQQLIDETRERFKHRQLTLEEKVRYNLE